VFERTCGFESHRPHSSSLRQPQLMTRLKSEPFGKIQYMKKIIRRVASVAAAGIAPLAFVTVISPAVSSADCAPGTEWWDPVANVCRPTGAPVKNCLPSGWWDPTIMDCRPF
jgi:hypothetical protein